MHSTHIGNPVLADVSLPTAQSVHMLLPHELACLPLGQSVQAVAEAAPSSITEEPLQKYHVFLPINLPGAQSRHAEAFDEGAYFPAGHSGQLLCPTVFATYRAPAQTAQTIIAEYAFTLPAAQPVHLGLSVVGAK